MLHVEVLRDWALNYEEAGRNWFDGKLDVASVSSPAGLARQLLQRIGITPPLQQHGEHAGLFLPEFMSHLSGGWLDCHPDYIGKPTPVVPLDLSSAYALSWCLTDCWSLMQAEQITTVDRTYFMRSFLQRDPETWLRPDVWRHFGCTIVEVQPQGEPWPVELGDLERAYVPLTSKRPMWFPWQTVVAAAVLSGKPPKVLSATKLVPVRKQKLHHVEVLPGLRILAHKDPVPELVKLRNQFPVLKTVVNSLCWGVLSEFHTTKHTEVPGPWCFPPIAATVSAGPRLILALLDRKVRDAWGQVIYRDTDSSYVTGLAPAHVSALAAEFHALDQGWGVWKKSDPCLMLVRGPKRYILFTREGELLDWKESNLRGTYLDPSGHPDWTKDYHERVIRRMAGPPYSETFPTTPTWLNGPAWRQLQNKPGDKGRPGSYRHDWNGDSLLTRLRLWHETPPAPVPDSIEVSGLRYVGSARDAIHANREGRELQRLEYGKTCETCGEPLPSTRRSTKRFCSDRCRHRARTERAFPGVPLNDGARAGAGDPRRAS